MSILPKGYKAPEGSGSFMKFEDGVNRFRILSEAKIGWKGWKDEESFAREGVDKNIEDSEVDLDNYGKKNVYAFWAVKVWDYKTDSIKILEIRQKGIMAAIQELEADPEWGDVREYDISVTQSKDGKRTKYTVRSSPQKPVSPDILEESEKSELDPADVFKEAGDEDFGEFSKGKKAVAKKK